MLAGSWIPRALLFCVLFIKFTAGADEFRIEGLQHQSDRAEIHFSLDAGFYYILWRGIEPTEIRLATAVALGSGSPNSLFDSNATNSATFYRVEKVPLTSIRDTDGDGISDAWELLHRNASAALNPNDAEEDHDGNGVADRLDALRENLSGGAVRGRPVLAAGNNHSLAIKTDGTLWGWGDNLFGELASSAFTETSSPVQIGTETNWSAVSIGGLTSYGLKVDGTLWVWGQISTGSVYSPLQIGTNHSWISMPRRNLNASPTALQADGTRWQFIGSFTNSQPLGSNDWAMVTDGPANSHWGIKTDGTLWKDLSLFDSNFGWTSLSLGLSHALALRTNGTLWAWASGSFPAADGQLGLGNSSPTMPTQVGTDTWATVCAGDYHSVGIKSDGSLWWWGVNYGFQHNESGFVRTNVPTRIGTNVDWLAVAADSFHTIVLRADGTIWTFGINQFGKLGNGSTALLKQPTQVGTDHDWSAASTGTSFSFGLKTNGTLWAWGKNSYGVLGVGDFSSDFLPRQVAGSNWMAISGGNDHTAALQSDGSLWVWGKFNYVDGINDVFTNSPTRLGADSDWFSISAGWQHSLATKVNRTLWAWGRNTRGELGNGMMFDNQNLPVQAGLSGAWSNISAGYYSSIGVRGSALYNWGNRVGSGSFGNTSPQQVGFDSDWELVTNGKNSGPTLVGHALALKRTGTLWSWGYNSQGQLGNGSNMNTTEPAQIGASTNWQSITAGSTFSGGLQQDGSLWMWGENAFGQLGSGTRFNANVVTRSGSETNWASLAAGNQHVIALKADGSLWAWGDNSFGQCAQPALFEPVAVSGTNWGKPH